MLAVVLYVNHEGAVFGRVGRVKGGWRGGWGYRRVGDGYLREIGIRVSV